MNQVPVDIDAEINVFIIGLRGYTQNYGGWEAFAQGLLNNWNDTSVHFYAFEKVESKSKENVEEVNGVTCIRVCETESGSSAMMKYDRNCTLIAEKIITNQNISNPILYHLGVRIGPYLWLKRRSLKNKGIKLMENPAGAEWRRTKWNKLVQIYLFVSAYMMAKSTDCLVCDNEGIRSLYKKILIGKKPNMEFVPYGVEVPDTVSSDIPQKVQDYFSKWGLEKDQYYLVLGRYVPENNYEMLIKGFMKSNSNRKLLIITNYKTEMKKFHKHIIDATHYQNDKRVIMAGTMYDKEILHYIRQYAHGYIHGHSVGGTNPGLLEAMAETDVCILYDVVFNRAVGGKAALYFKNDEELRQQIEKVDVISDLEKKSFGSAARRRMKHKYSWSHIVDEYDRLIHDLAEERNVQK